MANQIVNGKFLNNDTFSPFQSSGGMVHSCNNYYSLHNFHWQLINYIITIDIE